jgi:hypothetical protein
MVPVGRSSLQAYPKLIVKNVPSFKGRKITNKTGRGIIITHLNEALVPIDKETISHHTIDAFEKYNQKKKLLCTLATQKALSGEIKDGRPIIY